MAEPTHQTQTADNTVIQPRAEEAAAAAAGDPNEKAARETKSRMEKTGGFWNRLAPDKEADKEAKPVETKPDKSKEKEKETPASGDADQSGKQADKEQDREKKPKRRVKEPEIDPIELARVTGQEIGREMAKAAKPSTPAPTPATDVEFELPEEFKPDIAVFEEMARLDPKRYGNIKKELARYTQAEDEYITKWQQEHPDEPYDPESNEHDSFYAKIRPNYDQKDFKAAEKSLLKGEVRRELSEELRSHEAETERRRERAAQIQPEVERDMFGMLGDMVREIDPKNAELANDWKGLESLDQKNAMLADVMVAVHNQTKPAVLATMRLFRGVDAPDPKKPEHRHVFNIIETAEQRLSSLPIKDRYDDEGRLFATQADYSRMSPEEQARHWYIGERETIALIRGQAIKQTKSLYEAEKQKQARYNGGIIASQGAKPTQGERVETPAQTRPDNGSPSVSGRGTLPGDGQPAASGPKTGRDLFFSRTLGS